MDSSNLADVVDMRIGFIHSGYLLNKPEYIKYVLLDNHSNYRRDKPFANQIKSTLGDGLLSSLGGEEWLERRQIMQNAFKKESIENFSPIISEIALEMVEEWKSYAKNGEALDIQKNISDTFLRLVLRLIFGIDLREQDPGLKTAIYSFISYISDVVNLRWIFPTWVPLPRNFQFFKDVKVINEFVYGLIDKRFKKGEPLSEQITILDILVESKALKSGAKLNRQQLRNELCAFFVAGHDTIVGALSWTLYSIAQNSDVAKKLRKEFDEVLQGRNPTVSDLPSLKYTEMVVKESMRLYPSIFGLIREAVEDDVIDGYFIPKDTMLYFCPYTVHRSKDFWDEPDKFIPERFTKEEEAKRHKLAYFPFGAGPRICIGKRLAMVQTQLFMVNIIKELSLKLVADHPITVLPDIGLPAKHGIKMNLEIL